MTVPPLPASPCVRIGLDYTNDDGFKGGSRFYLAYDGSAPSGANCTTLAGDIAAALATNVMPNVSDNWKLTEVDVLDIATRSGLSGQWSGSDAGGDSGARLPSNVAVNVEFGIARRYRGGKPRMFLPQPGSGALLNESTWQSSFVTGTNTAIEGFFTALEALSIGSMGTLRHVNLSYYEGFTNITNSSGRERAVPTYRPTAILDTVTGYFTKPRVGSQRKRLKATTY